MGKFLARDSDDSPICVVDVLRGGERLKVYDYFSISTVKTPQRLYLSISQILSLFPFTVIKKSLNLKVKDMSGLHTSLPYTFSKYYQKTWTAFDSALLWMASGMFAKRLNPQRFSTSSIVVEQDEYFVSV